MKQRHECNCACHTTPGMIHAKPCCQPSTVGKPNVATTDAGKIGTHLATLNLFREADGKVYITVAEARGAMDEQRARKLIGVPIDYVEGLIYDAATTTLTARNRKPQ